MIDIGKYHILEVVKLVDFGVYLKADEEEILVPRKYVPENTNPGDKIEVFVYKDSEDRIIATTQRPYGVVGDFVGLVARQVTNFGAFMEWGIDKDLLVPFNEQHKKIQEGEKHVVRITLDPRTERLIGITKLQAFLSKDISDLKVNQKVNLLVYNFTELGAQVIIDQKYTGMIYKQDIFERLEVGDKKMGFIHNIREDGKLDVKLAGFDSIDTYKETILAKLEENNGYIPFHDNTDAEVIQQNLSMSKKSFKKAIGGLFKEGRITIGKDGVRLTNTVHE